MANRKPKPENLKALEAAELDERLRIVPVNKDTVKVRDGPVPLGVNWMKWRSRSAPDAERQRLREMVRVRDGLDEGGVIADDDGKRR